MKVIEKSISKEMGRTTSKDFKKLLLFFRRKIASVVCSNVKEIKKYIMILSIDEFSRTFFHCSMFCEYAAW